MTSRETSRSTTSDKARSFASDGTFTVLLTLAKMALGLVTGIIIARALGPEGRGSLTAVLTAPQMLGWLFGMGSGTSVAYYLSRDPSCGGRLLGTWLVILAPAGAAALAIAYTLLPSLLAAQSADTLALARVFLPTILLGLLSEVVLHILLGDQDFRTFNLLGLAHPAGTAVAYLGLWGTGNFTVAAAVAVQGLMTAAVLSIALAIVVRRHGIARPDRELGRASAWYAVRTHGEIVGGVVNQGLAMLIVPAFLAATEVGHYAIAANVSWLIVSVFSALATVMMPAAARRGGESGRDLVVRSFQATVVIGMIAGGSLFILADVAIQVVYGPDFQASVTPLRVLLPGVVLYAGASILLKGLHVENRPFTATLAQASGMVVTVAGLAVFLNEGGILTAAVVSSVSYALVFAMAVALYTRTARIRWQRLVPDGAFARAMATRALDRLPIRRAATATAED